MNREKLRAYYDQLTPEQKHFVDHKTINTTLSIRHWISFLSKTGAYDRLRDRTSNWLHVGIILTSIGLFITLIIAIKGGELTVVGTIFGVMVILLILMVRKRIALGKRNLSNYLRNFFLPLLNELKDKAGEEAKMIAALDFRDPLQQPFEEIEEPQFSRTVKLYTPKMIKAGVTLKDQNYLEFVMMDEIRKMTVRRRKTKYKTKTTHRIFVRLTVQKSVYTQQDIVLPENVEVEDQSDKLIYKLKHKQKETILSILEPAIFVAQMAGLYQLLSPVIGGNAAGFGAGAANLGAQASQAAMASMVWNDQIFSQYDRDGFSRRSTIRDRNPYGSDTGGSIFES